MAICHDFCIYKTNALIRIGFLCLNVLNLKFFLYFHLSTEFYKFLLFIVALKILFKGLKNLTIRPLNGVRGLTIAPSTYKSSDSIQFCDCCDFLILPASSKFLSLLHTKVYSIVAIGMKTF